MRSKGALGILIFLTFASSWTQALASDHYFKLSGGKSLSIYKDAEQALYCQAKVDECADRITQRVTPTTFVYITEEDAGSRSANFAKVNFFEIDETTSQCVESVSAPGERPLVQWIKTRITEAVSKKQPMNQVLGEIDAHIATLDPSADSMENFLKSQCVTHGTGWVDSTLLEPAAQPVFTEGVIPCTDDSMCPKNNTDITATKKVAEKIIKNALAPKAKLSPQELAHIRSCSGDVDFGLFQGTFSTSKQQKIKVCRFDLKDGCGEPTVGLYEKLKSADSLFMKAGTSTDLSRRCKEVLNASFADQCGPQKMFTGEPDEKQKQYLARFAELRNRVRELLEDDQTLDKVKGVKSSEGVLMCLFSEETTDLDPFKLNYSYCNNNPHSSAIGLGQITKDTLIDLAVLYGQKFPGRYPVEGGLDQLVSALQPKKNLSKARSLIDPLFAKLAEDEGLQIRAAIDTLVYKASGGVSISIALERYLDQRGPHAKKWMQVKNCADQCFKSRHEIKPLTPTEQARDDLKAATCMHAKIPTAISPKNVVAAEWIWEFLEMHRQREELKKKINGKSQDQSTREAK